MKRRQANPAPLDDARLLPRFRDRERMLAAQKRVVRKAIAEAVEEGGKITVPMAAGGDPIRLRGIPAIGRGASGAIRHTSPEAEAIRRDEHRRQNGQRSA